MIKQITGFSSKVVRLRILANIASLAFKKSGNLKSGFQALLGIHAKRKRVQGLQNIRKYVRNEGRYFFSDDIPGWPSEAFKGYFSGEVIRVSGINGFKAPFSTVFIAITSKCPMRCKHCYEWENISKVDSLSLDNLKTIIRKLKEYGVHHIQLSGGEPLDRMEDLISLITYSCKDADVWLNTSGFGLTPERAFSMKKAGLTGAEISLDHYDENEHNRFRSNEESFRWVKDAARNCRSAGILTSLSLCATNIFVTRENLVKYAELAMSWGICFIRILEPMETERFKGEMIRLADDRIALLEEFFLDAASPSKQAEYPIISYPGFHQKRIGCLGAGNHYLYIDSKGDIHACPFCRGSAGNAVTTSIEAAVEILKSRGCKLYETNHSD
jgi:MoaA/NifB/PqqE/SkfB family radical SAM enzyme